MSKELAKQIEALADDYASIKMTREHYSSRLIRLSPAIIAALRVEAEAAELREENARLREALAKDATRFEVCAGMIEQSFNASGTLRAERTMKAKHFALEALTALENRDD